MNQDDQTHRQIGDDDSEDIGESALSSDIKGDDLENQQEVLHLGQGCWEKSVCTTRVPLPKNHSRADTVIARTLLPISCNLPAAMAPPLLKHQKSSLFNKLSESDHVPSSWTLVLPNKSSGDQNCLQPKASSNLNIPQHHKATFELAKKFMEAIVFTKTPWPILSHTKYSMVDEAWKLPIEAQDCQQALTGAPIGKPSVCQLPGGPSLEINRHPREAVSLDFCVMLLYQTYEY
jgi:hypothetical protein